MPRQLACQLALLAIGGREGAPVHLTSIADGAKAMEEDDVQYMAPMLQQLGAMQLVHACEAINLHSTSTWAGTSSS